MLSKMDKAMKIVNKYIDRAKNEIGEYGYHENLGYEYYNKVLNEVGKLRLEYAEQCKVMSMFDKECDEL